MKGVDLPLKSASALSSGATAGLVRRTVNETTARDVNMRRKGSDMRERQQLRRLVSFAVVLSTVASVSVDGAARAAPRPLVNPFRTGRP